MMLARSSGYGTHDRHAKHDSHGKRIHDHHHHKHEHHHHHHGHHEESNGNVKHDVTMVALPHMKALTKGRLWSIQDFTLRTTVGTGTFSRVRVVKLKGNHDRTPFALKIMKKAEIIKLKQVQHVNSEKQIMSMIEHPFIVNLLTTFQDDRLLFMLMEFVNGGEIFSYLRKEGRFPNDHARFYAGEIILAFAYLHTMMIIYRDLKPENCLLDCEGHLKITDLGFAKVVGDVTWTLCGTPEYLAPEMIRSEGHGKGVDWWALGVLLFEMLAGYPPFYAENPFGIYQKILKGHVDFPRHMDVKVKDLIRSLLIMDPKQRFGCLERGADDLKRHKWYKGLDWDLLLNRSITPPFIPNVKSVDDTSMFEKFPDSDGAGNTAVRATEQEMFEGFSAELS